MAALDFIKDKKNPRKRMMESSWRSIENGSRVEIDGSPTGLIDWSKSRFINGTDGEGELWIWADETYYVLDRRKDIDNPPTPLIDIGPQPSSSSLDDDEV